MKLRKILCLLLLLALPMSAAAAEVDSGSVYCFGSQEFGENLQGVCLREIPAAGVLRLGERILRPGDVLTWEQLNAVTYTPDRTEEDVVETLAYLPVSDSGLGAETTLSLGIRGKKTRPPLRRIPPWRPIKIWPISVLCGQRTRKGRR